MATQSQKMDAISLLIQNPNEKLKPEYLEKIKLNMDFAKLKELPENLLIICKVYSSQSQILFVNFTIKHQDLTLPQRKILSKLGFTTIDGRLSASGFTREMVNELPLFKLIQNIETPIPIRTVQYDSIIFDFIEFITRKNKHDDKLKLIDEHFTTDELRMIDGSLGFDSLLTQSRFLRSPELNLKKVYFTQFDDHYRISCGGHACDHHSMLPLTISDVLRNVKLDMDPVLRITLIIHFLLGNIENEFVYEDKREAKDPLALFNEAIAALQAKQLPIDELAKELILLSSKHLA